MYRFWSKLNLKNLALPVNAFWGRFSHDVGIDLGTANTLVYVAGRGIVIREPSFLARGRKSKEILAIGLSAKKMYGKTPRAIEIVRPLKSGVIADFDAAYAMLSHYIKKVHASDSLIPKIPRPKVVLGVPSGITEVERRAVVDAAKAAGARAVYLVEEPMAAAIGVGLDVDRSDGIFIVDIGGGTTEIAVISLGGVVLGRSVRFAGDEMTEAIINYVKLKYSILIGDATAEEAKINIGCVSVSKEKYFLARGRDLEKGMPVSVKLTSTDIQEAIAPVVREIVSVISNLMEEVPPELMSDVMKSGIALSGGGSLIEGLSAMIEGRVGMKTYVVDDPLTAVARGGGKLLGDPELLNKIRITKGMSK